MLHGTLDTFSVAEVLSLIGASGATGTLCVPGHGAVECYDGDVTFATSEEGATMAELLVRTGFLSEGVGRAVDADADPLWRLTEALVEHSVDEQRLRAAVSRHVEEAVFELDRAREGEFTFEPSSTGTPLFITPMPDVLEAVAARADAWAAVERRLGSVDHVVVAAAPGDDDDGELTITRGQWRVLGAVDGQRSVRALAREVGLGLFAISEIVVALIDAGLVRVIAAEGRPSGLPDLPLAELPVPEPAVAEAPSAAPRRREFVEPGTTGSRELILQLLAAVKEDQWLPQEPVTGGRS